MTLTLADLQARVPHIAGRTHSRFQRFVDREDVEQELRLYLLAPPAQLLKWCDEGDEFRVMRALFAVARQHCEKEKAARSGYSFEDVAWYSPSKLADLVPLALNDGWDGLTGEGDENAGYGSADGREGGTLLAMIADIRRVIDRSRNYNPDTETGWANLEWLADRLGGEYPAAPGRGRKAMSNSKSQAATGAGWENAA